MMPTKGRGCANEERTGVDGPRNARQRDRRTMGQHGGLGSCLTEISPTTQHRGEAWSSRGRARHFSIRIESGDGGTTVSPWSRECAPESSLRSGRDPRHDAQKAKLRPVRPDSVRNFSRARLRANGILLGGWGIARPWAQWSPALSGGCVSCAARGVRQCTAIAGTFSRRRNRVSHEQGTGWAGTRRRGSQTGTNPGRAAERSCAACWCDSSTPLFSICA
jgi:hypothetical protein